MLFDRTAAAVPMSNDLQDTSQQTASADKWEENHTGQQTPGMVGAMQTELRYERWFLPLSVPLGLGPKKSEVRIVDGTLHVKMGWAFEAHIPVASITRAEPCNERARTAGVHYSNGRWLVNGSGTGLVALTIEPPVQAKVAVRTVTLRSLWVGVTDPEALIAACTGATA